MTVLFRLKAVFTAWVFALSSQFVAAQESVPLSAYGALPDVEDAAISPSGDNIAVLLSQDGKRMLFFLNSEMKLTRHLAVGDAKVRGLQWIGDERLILYTSQTEGLRGGGNVEFTKGKHEFYVGRIIPVNAEGSIETVFGSSRQLVDAVFGNYGTRLIDGHWVAHFGAIELEKAGSKSSQYVFRHGRPYLYSLDVERNSPTRLAAPGRSGTDRDWLIDERGKVVASMDVSADDGDWQLQGPGGNVIASGNERNGRVGLIGLGFNGDTIIYSTRDDDNFRRFYEIPFNGGEAKAFLGGLEINGFYFDPRTGHLIGYRDEERNRVFNNPAYQKAVAGIRQAFADFDLVMIDWTPDFEKVLVRTSGNKDSGTWYVVDLANGSANAFAYERMAIGPKEVGPISTFAYTAGDGLEMDGILTLPPGREAKNLPVVALPHGGPHSRDAEAFDWWAQAFASRGYAVFQPNFRGSTNRGQEFKLAGYGEWGRAMQTDISDGLEALAAKGVIDMDRACIVGASYGGYAALAGVTVQQGVYRCAVAVAPVSDIQAMYNEDVRTSGGARITKKSLLDQLGPRDRWDAVSPRLLAARADAPIMLIHGRDDTVVPYSHSSEMADKLKDAGKPYRLVELKGEDHWLSLSETRLKMLEESVNFVEKHNPAD